MITSGGIKGVWSIPLTIESCAPPVSPSQKKKTHTHKQKQKQNRTKQKTNKQTNKNNKITKTKTKNAISENFEVFTPSSGSEAEEFKPVREPSGTYNLCLLILGQVSLMPSS